MPFLHILLYICSFFTYLSSQKVHEGNTPLEVTELQKGRDLVGDTKLLKCILIVLQYYLVLTGLTHAPITSLLKSGVVQIR